MSQFTFVAAERAHHNVRMLCRLLNVSHSGCYAWHQGRAPLQRPVVDGVLLEQIRA